MVAQKTKTHRKKRLWHGVFLLAFVAVLGGVSVAVSHILRPVIDLNKAASQVETAGGEVRNITWAPVYMTFQGENAPRKFQSASQYFDQLDSVTQLEFEETEVTKEMIPPMHKLRSLQVLMLNDVRISQSTLEQIKQEFPKLEFASFRWREPTEDHTE